MSDIMLLGFLSFSKVMCLDYRGVWWYWWTLIKTLRNKLFKENNSFSQFVGKYPEVSLSKGLGDVIAIWEGTY